MPKKTWPKPIERLSEARAEVFVNVPMVSIEQLGPERARAFMEGIGDVVAAIHPEDPRP